MNDFSARVRSRFTPDELRAYRKHFDSFDLNGDGVISAAELGKVADCVGYRMTNDDIKSIMRAIDLDSSGTLSFDEFLLAMPGNVNIPKDEHKAAEIRRMFMNYDKDGDGMVTIEEAHEVLRKELAFTVKQSIDIVKKYDKNGDGQLSYEEFVSFYKEIRSKASHIRQLFQQFDRDNSGTVSLQEAKDVLRKIDIPEAEVESLVAIHDRNKDGELQYEEFVTFLLLS